MGSCLSNSIDTLLDLESTKNIYRKVSLINEECHQCPWLIACGGGCAHQRWLNGGFGSPFPHCGVRRQLFEYIKDRVGDLSQYKAAMITS